MEIIQGIRPVNEQYIAIIFFPTISKIFNIPITVKKMPTHP